MDDARGLWSEWQALLSAFHGVFTLGGWARIAQWVTGTVLCPEEHTITQMISVLLDPLLRQNQPAAAGRRLGVGPPHRDRAETTVLLRHVEGMRGRVGGKGLRETATQPRAQRRRLPCRRPPRQ